MAGLDEQLYHACNNADWAQAAFLLEAGAGTEWREEEEESDDEEEEEDDGGGYTAIMLAAIFGSLETVTLLFNRGANIHARDNNGDNALMYASYFNRANVVSNLTDKGKL